MEIVLVMIVVYIGVLFAIKQIWGNPGSRETNDQARPSEPGVTPQNQRAMDALTRVTNTCQMVGGDGFSSLLVAASADGKVSRDELRIIMWFCEALGAKFLDDDVTYVSQLNASVNLNVISRAGGAAKIAADCGDLDLATLARLYAAHASIGKPWNKTAKRTSDALTVIEGLIAAKVAAN